MKERTYTASALAAMLRRMRVVLFAAALCISAGSAFAAPPSGYSPYTGSEPIIASVDSQTNTVTLNLVGAEGNNNDGYNFNTYANGDMIIDIPQGWTVNVTFTVQGQTAHSAVIVPWSNRSGNSFIQDAFPGSGVTGARSGYTQDDPPQHFTFTASSAGQYAIICAVPGHVDVGMWDEMDVVEGLAAPQVYVK